MGSLATEESILIGGGSGGGRRAGKYRGRTYGTVPKEYFFVEKVLIGNSALRVRAGCSSVWTGQPLRNPLETEKYGKGVVSGLHYTVQYHTIYCHTRR